MEQQETSASRTLVTRRALEVVAALFAFAFGTTIILGALEYHVGWGDRGPEPGYFPFWMGLIVVVGSIGALFEALLSRRHADAPVAINADQARRIVTFLLPMVGFLALALVFKLGLYVAMVAYVLTVMLWQGRYRLPAALAVSLGTAAAFYFMFELWLHVPLMKGPIEAWFGLH